MGGTMHRVRCVLMAVLLGTVSVLGGISTATAADGPPVNTAAPSIVGTVAVGETVTADPGTWDPADVTYSYTWFVDDQPVATGEQYTPVAADEGRRLTLEVTASRPGAEAGTATSEPATVLGTAPQNLEAPAVSGAFIVGGTVQVSDGTWDADGLIFTYQWMRGSAPIAGATGPSYASTWEDCNQDLSAVVTAHLAGHADGVAATPTFSISCYYCRCSPPPVNVQIHVPERVTTQDRAKVRIRVRGAGNSNPSSGTVTLRVTRVNGHVRWIRTMRLHDSSKVTFRLPRLPVAGKYSARARYDSPPGSEFMDGDNVTTFKVVQAG